MADIEQFQFNGSEIGLSDKYLITIDVHPGDSGMPIAAELDARLGPVRQDIYLAQQIEGQPIDRIKAFNGAIKGLYTAIPYEQLTPLSKRVLAHTAIGIEGEKDALKLSNPTHYSKFFKKNYKALIPLMKRVIEVNDFLELDMSALFLEVESYPQEKTDSNEKEI